MKLFRILVSVFLVLLGVMMVVTWAFSSKSVQAIENGDAAAKLTNTLLSNPQVAELAADKATDALHTELAKQYDSRTFETLWKFAETPIHKAIVNVIGSDFVANAAQTSASKVQEGLVKSLTKEDRPYGPLMLTVDVSPRVNDRVDQIPLVGNFVPQITVPSLELEVMSAEVFQDIRSAYSAAKWISAWFVWIGLLLIALGVLVSPRRRWFFARSMLIVGALVLAIGFTVDAIGAHTLARLMPGGAEGGLGVTVDDLLSDTAIPTVSNLLLKLGSIALGLALITVLATRFVPAFRDRGDAGPGSDAQAQGTAEPAGAFVEDVAVPVAVGAESHTGGAEAHSGVSMPTSIAASAPVSSETLAHPREDHEDFEEFPVLDDAGEALSDTEGVSAPADAVVAPPATRPAAKKPAAKKPTPKKPTAKKAPTPKKPAAKKPTPKKPAPKKPAAASGPEGAKPSSAQEPPASP